MIAPTTKAEGIINNFIIPLDRLPTACDAFISSIYEFSRKRKCLLKHKSNLKRYMCYVLTIILWFTSNGRHEVNM